MLVVGCRLSVVGFQIENTAKVNFRKHIPAFICSLPGCHPIAVCYLHLAPLPPCHSGGNYLAAWINLRFSQNADHKKSGKL
jgi:hypothetical protein